MKKKRKKLVCIDCGKPLSNYRAKRCKSCANTGKNNPGYKHGKYLNNKHCPDCDKKVSVNGTYCIKCSAKYNTGTFKKGKGHPNYIDGKSKTREWQYAYFKNLRENNLHYKIRDRVGSLLRAKLKSRVINKNRKQTFDILPYTIDELMLCLQSKFKPGMTWDNIHLWHIDHIKPDSLFNYKTVSDKDFFKSWNLNNLQPLWAEDNRKKGRKWTK